MKTDRRLPWLAAALFLVTGCAALARLEPPRVQLADLALQEVKLFETAFAVKLRVSNPNPVAIRLVGADFKLEMMGHDFASGVSGAETEIPAYGSEVLPVTVYSSVLDMARGLAGLKGKDRIDYRISGRVRFGAGAGLPLTVPFDSAGSLSLAPAGGGQ